MGIEIEAREGRKEGRNEIFYLDPDSIAATICHVPHMELSLPPVMDWTKVPAHTLSHPHTDIHTSVRTYM